MKRGDGAWRGAERRGRARGGSGKEGGGGNTGTSHELNRTANSSTREGAGQDGEGRGFRGGGGTDRFYITLRTHTHTKETGHKLHFRSKLRRDSMALSSSVMMSALVPAPNARFPLNALWCIHGRAVTSCLRVSVPVGCGGLASETRAVPAGDRRIVGGALMPLLLKKALISLNIARFVSIGLCETGPGGGWRLGRPCFSKTPKMLTDFNLFR